MSYDPAVHHRHSIRLKGYDYSRAGAYFITICTHQRECLFGKITGGEMQLNDLGGIVQEEWQKSAVIRAEIELGEFVVMPNHIHAIVIITDGGRGDRPVAPTDGSVVAPADGSMVAPADGSMVAPADVSVVAPADGSVVAPADGSMVAPADVSVVAPADGSVVARHSGPAQKSIGAWVGGFKSAITTRVNAQRGTPGAPVWQRNYWEHIIRDQKSYQQIAEYIAHNPAQWELDQLHPGGLK